MSQERIITLDGRRVLTADERTPVYYPETIEAYAASRPGRGTRTDLRSGSAPIADTNKGGPSPK